MNEPPQALEFCLDQAEFWVPILGLVYNPSFTHSGRPFLTVAPPMCCLSIVDVTIAGARRPDSDQGRLVPRSPGGAEIFCRA